MWEPMSGIGTADLYPGATRTTVEATNPPVASGPAKTAAHNLGLPSQVFGLQLPVLIGLAALTIILIRYYD